MLSSFLSPAEHIYVPIEGQCLGVVSSLDKTRHYTQGCDKLVICTDHKPLIPIITTMYLDSLGSQILMILVQKTLSWKIEVLHILGKKSNEPDALSCTPVLSGPVNQVAGTIQHGTELRTSNTIKGNKELRWTSLPLMRLE